MTLSRESRLALIAKAHEEWAPDWEAKTTYSSAPADGGIPSQHAEGGLDADCDPEADADLVARIHAAGADVS